jgi:hypothetical protein
VTQSRSRDEEARAIVARNIDIYVQKRLAYYEDPGLLGKVFAKNPLIPPLKGAHTASEWVHENFLAHESSSEETVMGGTWQQILTELSVHAVGAGDFLFEEGDTLWVLEMKSQTNTFNAPALAQTLKVLKQRVVDHSQARSPRRRVVKAAIGILRGTPLDTTRTYIARVPENQDINGFQYRYLVGAPFVLWLTGIERIEDMVDVTGGQSLKSAREACRQRLQDELRQTLNERDLPDEFRSITLLIGTPP